MEPLRVVILAAGNGTRMGQWSHMHKGLLPVRDKAIISHIIDAYPDGTRFTVACQSQHQDLIDYLEIAHEKDDIGVVIVKGTKTPMETLLECRSNVEGSKSPIEVVPCDGIFEYREPRNQNWIGVSYGLSQGHYEKVLWTGDNYGIFGRDDSSNRGFIFTGRLRISQPKLFFDILWRHTCKWMIDAAYQYSDLTVINEYAAATHMTVWHNQWKDYGRQALWRPGTFFKPNEATYMVGHRVVKWFADATIVENRVKRGAQHKDVFVPPDRMVNRYYAYDLVEGKTLYEECSTDRFSLLLDWLSENLWEDRGEWDRSDEFYNQKTTQRIAGLEIPFGLRGDTRVPEPMDHRGIRSPIHGDLQFDNILWTEDGFKLIDWRQDFAGDTETGDLYYDFSKLLAGILVNIRKLRDPYHYLTIYYKTPWKNMGGKRSQYVEILRRKADQYDMDWDRIIEITSLIYMNMAGLHGDKTLKDYLYGTGLLLNRDREKSFLFRS